MSEIVTKGAVAQELEFDPASATVDAIQRALYRLSDRLSAEIRVDRVITARVYPAEGENLDELLADLRNTVLDEVLRERIRQETESARNLILALAFSQTGVVPEG